VEATARGRLQAAGPVRTILKDGLTDDSPDRTLPGEPLTARQGWKEEPMLTLRKANERGHADHGWLNTHHTFSFADYHDPAHMGFGPLRVINDDTVAAGAGFPPHAHRDMEIISYVIAGALEHRDNMGNGSVIRPGDVQRMSAGRGVVHSEFNASKEQPVHFLQIWIVPRRTGLEAGYEQKAFSEAEKRGRLRLVASPEGADGSLRIEQDVRMFAAVLDGGGAVRHSIDAGRKGWLHVVEGSADLNGQSLATGDGVAITGAEQLTLRSGDRAELLLFDMGG
jgi:redox-sensitive bicupin YhaK (pirin superfamily)